MKSVKLTMLALLGIVLFGAALAQAEQADWTTTLNVKLALLNKLGTDSLHIDVDSAGGTVTLQGTVDKRETKELATTVAKSVGSVKSVNNQIRLEAAVANPSKAGAAVSEGEAEVKDAVLETKVRLALVDKMGADGFKIGTEVANGVVTLGFARDLAADRRQTAMSTAKSVEGVVKVLSVDKH